MKLYNYNDWKIWMGNFKWFGPFLNDSPKLFVVVLLHENSSFLVLGTCLLQKWLPRSCRWNRTTTLTWFEPAFGRSWQTGSGPSASQSPGLNSGSSLCSRNPSARWIRSFYGHWGSGAQPGPQDRSKPWMITVMCQWTTYLIMHCQCKRFNRIWIS